jgi:iron complex outermembrane receptor protein
MRITDALDLTVDLQGRWITYDFAGPDENGALTDQSVKHAFFNPKLGLRYVFSKQASAYLLTGVNHKEPNRDDYVESTPVSRPNAEQLWDTEIGFRFGNADWRFDITGYSMQYRDHLVPTGRLNDVGAYTRVNVDKCSRLGTEIILAWTGVSRLELEGQATLSRNRIERFDEYIDNWATGEQDIVTLTDTRLAFSPELLLQLMGRYGLYESEKHKVFVSGAARYIGEQYADNTSNPSALLDAYSVVDLGVEWTIAAGPKTVLGLKAQLRNAFNAAYESNGWIYRFRSPGYDPVPDDPYAVSEGGDQYVLKGYFPQAGRNFWLQAELRF